MQSWRIHVQTPSLIHTREEIILSFSEASLICRDSVGSESLAVFRMVGDDQIGEEYS